MSHPKEVADLIESAARAVSKWAMGRLRAGSNVKSWLFTIQRNIWFNQFRQQRVAKLVAMDGEESAMDIAEIGKDPYTFYVSRMEHEQVREAIQELPLDFREVILVARVRGTVLSRDSHDFGAPQGR